MRLHKTRSTRDRKYPTQLAKISFDEILDLTADVFSFIVSSHPSYRNEHYPKARIEILPGLPQTTRYPTYHHIIPPVTYPYLRIMVQSK